MFVVAAFFEDLKTMIRKHHNAHKRAQAVFSNVRLWSRESMREDGTQIAHGMARVGFVWRDLDQKQVTGIIAKTNNWVIVCRAFCCLNGQTWVESEAMAARAVKVNDFEALYADMRRYAPRRYGQREPRTSAGCRLDHSELWRQGTH